MPDPHVKIPAGGYLNYGAYTSILQDDTIFWNMGGNGLVPYGTPRPPHNGPPDLVDAIQVTRQAGPGFGDGSCAGPPPIVDPAAAMPGMAPPPVIPRAENPPGELPAGEKPATESPTLPSQP